MGKKHKLDEKTYPTDETARVFRRNARTLQLWHHAGCPRVKPGRWDLREVVEWWAREIYSADRGADADPNSELQKARTDYWQSKAKITAIAAEKAADAVFAKNEVLTAWVERIIAVCSGLEALADRLPPLLAGKSTREMQPIIKKEIRLLREAFAREGRYCPTPGPLTKLLVDYHAAERKSDAK